MRDIGFRFEHYDEYCENIFAKNFDQSRDRYNAITAFEVMEHVENPLAFIKQNMLHYQPTEIIFSTKTYSGSAPSKDWWYYTFDTGQHITFYTEKALEHLAEKLGFNYYNLYSDVHLFTKNPRTQRQIKRELKFGLYNWKEKQCLKS